MKHVYVATIRKLEFIYDKFNIVRIDTIENTYVNDSLFCTTTNL